MTTPATIVASDVEAGIVAVAVTGDADIAIQQELTASIRGALNRDAHVIVDVSAATFIDASLIRVLINGYNEATTQGGKLVLQAGTAAVVERVIQLSRVEEVIPRVRSRDEGVRMIKSPISSPGLDVGSRPDLPASLQDGAR